MPDIEINLESNIVWIGGAGFEAHHEKVIVLQDDYRSGMECKTCLDSGKHSVSGREVSTVICEVCMGSGKRPKAGNKNLEVRCSDCEGNGWKICPDCGGKGGTIVLAENTKGRPMTGTIVSLGKEVKLWERGDKCMYPSYSGHAYDLKAFDRKGRLVEVVLLVISETDIIVRMHGTLEQNTVKRSMALHTNS